MRNSGYSWQANRSLEISLIQSSRIGTNSFTVVASNLIVERSEWNTAVVQGLTRWLSCDRFTSCFKTSNSSRDLTAMAT
jgi:hypothetical protein